MSRFLSAGGRLHDSAGPPLECPLPRSVGGMRSQPVIRGPGLPVGWPFTLACESRPHQEG